MEFCINKKTKEKIFAFDIRNEYGIKDFLLEKKLRKMSINEELICPECGTPVILRAGEIKIPHFSHKVKVKGCFYSNYTYNESRVKALKILYNNVKKYKDIKILGLSKNFKDHGVIDILLERGIYKKRKYAIMIKNTMEDINKWEKLHTELLEEKIAPIYFNYGTTKEIKSFKEKISRSFFCRNLMNLSTNHGIRLIDIENEEIYTLNTIFYLNEKNRLTKYENILHKNNYKDFNEFFNNSVGKDSYKFFGIETENQIEKILEYKEQVEPFLMLDSNDDIFLVMNIDKCTTKGENEFKTLRIKYITLNDFRFNSVNSDKYMYFYPKEQLFKEKCFADYYSPIGGRISEQLEEFLIDSDFEIKKVIPIDEAGFFMNNIEEFIKNYEKIKNKIFKYDYISENSKKNFKLDKFENLNNININDVINNKKNKEFSDLEKIIDFLKDQFYNFYEVIFDGSYLNKIICNIEDNLFISDEKESIELEKLCEIFKSLLKINKPDGKNFRLLFTKSEIKSSNLTNIFFDVFSKKETVFKYKKVDFYCHKGMIVSFFEKNEYELNILNTYYKIVGKNSIEEKSLEIFKNSFKAYSQNEDLSLFLMNIKRIEEKLRKQFLVENIDKIVSNKMKELLGFIVKNIELDKHEKKKYKNLDYILNNEIEDKEVKTFFEKIKTEKSIILFESILGTKYEKMFSSKEIVSILINNYSSEEGIEIVKKYILKNKSKLNIQDKDGNTLFSLICMSSCTKEMVEFCLENGANLYIKDSMGVTPFMLLERKFSKDILKLFLNK